MREIPLTQGKIAIVDDEDYERLSSHKWFVWVARGVSYAGRHVYIKDADGKLKQQSILMHRVVADANGVGVVDHVNGDGLDNRRHNLRICTQQQNTANNRRARGKSGFRGVYGHRNRWEAKISHNRRMFHIGSFGSPEDAAIARDAVAKRINGKFAVLNFPTHPQC